MAGRVLIIAGSDPSGGAGVQADLKTATAFGAYAAAAITALTVQNTTGVFAVRQVEPDDSATFVRALATPSAGMARSGEVLVLHDQRERLRDAAGTSFEFAGPPELLESAPLPTQQPAPAAAAGGAP